MHLTGRYAHRFPRPPFIGMDLLEQDSISTELETEDAGFFTLYLEQPVFSHMVVEEVDPVDPATMLGNIGGAWSKCTFSYVFHLCRFDKAGQDFSCFLRFRRSSRVVTASIEHRGTCTSQWTCVVSRK